MGNVCKKDDHRVIAGQKTNGEMTLVWVVEKGIEYINKKRSTTQINKLGKVETTENWNLKLNFAYADGGPCS